MKYILFIVLLAIVLLGMMIFPKPSLKISSTQRVLDESTSAQKSMQFSHVFLIMLENHNLRDIVHNPQAPYINYLADTYTLATNFSAITHPSLPNYLALTGGDTFGISSDCNDCFVQAPSIFLQLEKNAMTWKAYLENMPENCYLQDYDSYPLHHNPAAYYTPLRQSCQKNDVPFTKFSHDIEQNTIPTFVWISPNNEDNMHTGTIQQADTWVQKIVPQIMITAAYKNNGVIFLTWDESSTVYSDNTIPLIVISPLAKKHFTTNTPYSLYSLLHTIEKGLNLSPLNHAATAPIMHDVFQ